MTDFAYAVHTDDCTYLLDDTGICIWVLSPSPSMASKLEACVGAQFVACLDARVKGFIVGEIAEGASALLVATSKDTGRAQLLRTGLIRRVQYRDPDQALDVMPGLEVLDELELEPDEDPSIQFALSASDKAAQSVPLVKPAVAEPTARSAKRAVEAEDPPQSTKVAQKSPAKPVQKPARFGIAPPVVPRSAASTPAAAAPKTQPKTGESRSAGATARHAAQKAAAAEPAPKKPVPRPAPNDAATSKARQRPASPSAASSANPRKSSHDLSEDVDDTLRLSIRKGKR